MPSLIFQYVIYHVYCVICHTPSFPPGIPPPSMLVFVPVFWKQRCAGLGMVVAGLRLGMAVAGLGIAGMGLGTAAAGLGTAAAGLGTKKPS